MLAIGSARVMGVGNAIADPSPMSPPFACAPKQAVLVFIAIAFALAARSVASAAASRFWDSVRCPAAAPLALDSSCERSMPICVAMSSCRLLAAWRLASSVFACSASACDALSADAASSNLALPLALFLADLPDFPADLLVPRPLLRPVDFPPFSAARFNASGWMACHFFDHLRRASGSIGQSEWKWQSFVGGGCGSAPFGALAPH